MPFVLHIAPQIKSKWRPLRNRNVIHRPAPAPAHNTRDKCRLHRVPARTRYQHRHKERKQNHNTKGKNGLLTDSTVKVQTPTRRKSFISTYKLTKFIYFRCFASMWNKPTLKYYNVFCVLSFFFVCLCFFLDRLDWTTETEYKQEFTSEQVFYTKLP